MKDHEFVQIYKGNMIHFEDARLLWVKYILEHDESMGKQTNIDFLLDDLDRRIRIQGSRPNMHFEILYVEEKAIGIAYYAIDLGGIKGLIAPGYGYLMEFFILKEYRMQGWGRFFYEHIEATLKSDGGENLYLTPTSLKQQRFWIHLGFKDSHINDPDNDLPIYTKELPSN